jgi:hypothetical protein
MPSLPSFFDRRLALFLCVGALAGALGLKIIPDGPAIKFVSFAGYWFIFATFSLFCWSLWRSCGNEVRSWNWRKADWITIATVAAGGIILLVHEAGGFKIVMDEIMLLGASMSMHFDRVVAVPFRGNDVTGVFVLQDSMMDKRPLFFPFLLSLLHDVTGYRPENAFLLNGILTFVFLGLIAALGRRLAGRMGASLGVVLLAGLPLLGQNATGGGFELLNLVMISGTMLLGARFIERRDESSFTALAFGAALMLQVRYESALFAVPVVVLVLWVWQAAGKNFLSWPVFLIPALLLPYPLQHRIFDLRTSAWEMASRPGNDTPFALHYVADNLAHAANFLFGTSRNQPNSILLSCLGCIAFVFFLLVIVRRLPALRSESSAMSATVIFTLGFVAQFALMMVYFWGAFDDPVIRRLSLPTHLGFVLFILAVLPQFALQARRIILGLSVLSVVAVGIPSMSAHAYDQEYTPGREVAWRRKFMAERPLRDYLMIDNDSILWVAHRVSATPVVQAVQRKEAIAFNFRNRTFSDIFVFQRLNIEPSTGVATFRKDDDLGPDYVLETVKETRLHPLTVSRISRVREIRNGAQTLTAPEKSMAKVSRTPEIAKEAHRQYMEKYLRQLP